jgi:CRISPR type III-A-associated RAMP protein Csm4
MPIYHLTLRGPLHIGEAVGIDREAVLDWMPSDSLFSALVAAWAEFGADVPARLAAFQSGEPPFRLTSAFPWAAGIRFYPKPELFPQFAGLEGKKAKKVRWLSAGVVAQLCEGIAPKTEAELLLHHGAVWVMPNERQNIPDQLLDLEGQPRLWQTYVVPRVTVDRASNSSNLFNAGRVSYAAEGGLWFAARGRETHWVSEALTILADSGLGGLRNYGHGAFEVKEISEDLPEANAEAGFLLARYAPTSASEIESTLQAKNSLYRLVTVGGWSDDDAGQGWRRRAVRLVAEGALFSDPSAARGQLVEVQPRDVPQFKDRKVYRYGVPFFIPAGRMFEEVEA